MSELDFETDTHLQLLTEALRAGPGTPQWRDALAILETTPGADEYKLLYTARERLASGRGYREIRPGPGFTRKVNEAIDQEESAGPRGVPSANLIAAVSALVILGIVIAVGFFIIPRAGRQGQDLSQTYFVDTRVQSDFGTGMAMEFGAFGPLPIEAKAGLRPVLRDLEKETFLGGGVIYERTFVPDQPFAIESIVRVSNPVNDVALQIFVTDDPNFAGESATSSHELVWMLRGNEASVARPDGTVEGPGARVQAGRDIDVRITVNHEQAAIEMNGKKLWSGPNQLSARRQRMIGIRFLARGAAQKDSVSVQSLRVLVPQKQ